MNKNQPLWMPPGSVRAILAIMGMVPAVYQIIVAGSCSEQAFSLAAGSAAAYGILKLTGGKS